MKDFEPSRQPEQTEVGISRRTFIKRIVGMGSVIGSAADTARVQNIEFQEGRYKSSRDSRKYGDFFLLVGGIFMLNEADLEINYPSANQKEQPTNPRDTEK
jgi:hypothetical protein